MSKMSRKKKNHKNIKYEANIVVMLVEGETEENYIRHLNFVFGKGYRLKIRKKSILSSNIKEDIRKILLEESIDTDELILLYDLENSQIEYNKFVSRGELRHKSTYLVQPCIEAHFLMHHGVAIPSNKYMSSTEVLSKLKRVFPEYSKGKFSWGTYGIGKDEILTAKRISNENFKGLEEKSFSMLGALVDKYFHT